MALAIQQSEADPTKATATSQAQGATQATSTEGVDTSTLQPGTPEYEAHMAQLGRQARGEAQEEAPQDNQQSVESRPEWLPEKFWSDGKPNYEALAKSYAELERSRAKPADNSQDTKQEDKPPVQAFEVDYDALTKEFYDNGKLTDETVETLVGKGLPKALIEKHVELLTKDQVQQEQAIMESIGGKEAYLQMVQWASQSLSPAEIQAFNTQVNMSGDVARVAVKGLHAMFVAANGQAPRLIQGSSSGAGPVDVFKSNFEVVQAMSDPRYSKDPAYRQAVYDKLQRSQGKY